MISPLFNNETRLARSVRRLHTERVAMVRISLLLFFFLLRACAVRGRSMRTSISWRHFLIPHSLFLSTTWVMMSKSSTSSFISESFMIQARPWLVPSGAESWPARAPWVSPVGGNRSHSEGETVLVLSRKGKEDYPELLMLLAVILKETCSTLEWFLAPAQGSAVFPRAKFARGPTVPRTEDSTAGEHQQTTLGCSTQTSSPSPSKGLGRRGQLLQRTTCGSRGKREHANQKGPTTEQKGKILLPNNYSNLESRQHWKKNYFW